MLSVVVLYNEKRMVIKGKVKDVPFYLQQLTEQNPGVTLQTYIDSLRPKMPDH